jgi:tellurite resistance protein
MTEQFSYTHYVNLNQPCDALAIHEDAVNALIAARALVAVADGCLDEAERDKALDYIEERRFAPRSSRRQIAERFDACARRLQSTDFVGLVLDALRPVPGLGLALDVVAIAEEVAAADGTVHPSEVKTIALLKLVTTALPEPKMVQVIQ